MPARGRVGRSVPSRYPLRTWLQPLPQRAGALLPRHRSYRAQQPPGAARARPQPPVAPGCALLHRAHLYLGACPPSALPCVCSRTFAVSSGSVVISATQAATAEQAKEGRRPSCGPEGGGDMASRGGPAADTPLTVGQLKEEGGVREQLYRTTTSPRASVSCTPHQMSGDAEDAELSALLDGTPSQQFPCSPTDTPQTRCRASLRKQQGASRGLEQPLRAHLSAAQPSRCSTR